MKRKALAWLLTLCMVITMLPTFAFAAEAIVEQPNAEVTVMEPIVLEANEYSVWNGSGLANGEGSKELQAVMNFKANDTAETAQASPYAEYKTDFSLKFTGLTNGKITADGCYLAGKYGEEGDYADLGWIVIPTDGLEVVEGQEYGIVSNYDENLTYENICDYVKEFTAALYIAPEILRANPDLNVELSLKMTNPEDENDVITVGEPAVYTVTDLWGLPNATVTVDAPMWLEDGEYSIWDGSLKTGVGAKALQSVMTFKANDTFEEAQNSPYAKYKTDFALKFTGLAEGTITADDCYLAGKYGESGDYAYLGWIVIPTDGLVVEEGEEYGIVSNYDANLTYENICDYVKEFTAALYIAPEILEANPDLKVELSLKMTNPDDENDVLTIGEPAEYDATELLGLPNATVTVEKPIILEAEEYDIWNGSSLSEGEGNKELQAVMNFKANDSLEDAQKSLYAKYKTDFSLKFTGLEEEKITANGCYLAGKYGAEGDYAYLGWIVIPTDGLEVVEGEEYGIVSNYDANLTYENICDYVKEFTAALYIAPEILEANPDLKVELSLKMTNPYDDTDTLTIGKPAVYDYDDFVGNVAQVNDQKFKTLSEAFAVAESDDTVYMLNDYVDPAVTTILDGETLDLNGCTLKTDYVAAFGDIIDSSADNSGLLVAPDNHILIQMDNTQLPVKANGGYKFYEVKVLIGRDTNNIYKAGFQPCFEAAAHDAILAGEVVSGVKVIMQVSWTKNGDKRVQNFEYSDSLISGFIGSYANDAYSKMLTLTLKNAEETNDLTFKAIVKSDLNVEICSKVK